MSVLLEMTVTKTHSVRISIQLTGVLARGRHSIKSLANLIFNVFSRYDYFKRFLIWWRPLLLANLVLSGTEESVSVMRDLLRTKLAFVPMLMNVCEGS